MLVYTQGSVGFDRQHSCIPCAGGHSGWIWTRLLSGYLRSKKRGQGIELESEGEVDLGDANVQRQYHTFKRERTMSYIGRSSENVQPLHKVALGGLSRLRVSRDRMRISRDRLRTSGGFLSTLNAGSKRPPSHPASCCTGGGVGLQGTRSRGSNLIPGSGVSAIDALRSSGNSSISHTM